MDKIIFKNVYKSFDKNLILDNINFEINKGEIVAILGPSGCGKTTLLRILAGLENPEKGIVEILGKKVFDLEINELPSKRNISMVFQNYALWPHKNVYKNISYALEIEKFDKETIKNKVKDVLDMVGLSNYENRSIDTLSGGEKQRVAIARAIITEPKVLLLDEPLSNLDIKVKNKLRNELRTIVKKLDTTVIFVTHDKNDAMYMADKIMVIGNGIIQDFDTVKNIYSNPKNIFTADFVGEYNILQLQEDTYIYDYIDSMDSDKNLSKFKYIAVLPKDIIIKKSDNKNIFIKDIIFLGEYREILISCYNNIIRYIHTDDKFEYNVYDTVDIEFNKKIYYIN